MKEKLTVFGMLVVTQAPAMLVVAYVFYRVFTGLGMGENG